MKYSAFVLVALIIFIVITFDVFRKKSNLTLPVIKSYRLFLLSIGAYFLVDFLWGLFYEYKLPRILYVDNFIYFIVMGATILFWTRYAVKYLSSKDIFAKIIQIAGALFFLAEIILLIINCFVPILFTINMEECTYQAYRARDIMLYVQILMYFIVAIYTIVATITVYKTVKRRHLCIAVYCLLMASTITIQIFDPLIPVYSVGCLIGVSMLNSFVVNDVKEEYHEELVKSRIQMMQSQNELGNAKHLAYTDPLTNIHNKHAYVEEEERIDKLIGKNQMDDFAVVVFDLNGLKYINDTKGHDVGDQYIIESCEIIKKFFGEKHVYRFGGDEFVAILEDDEYNDRQKKLDEFEKVINENLRNNHPVISSGMSKYKKGTDNTFQSVFKRADKIMYARKVILKEKKNY